jgi:hypothetical protein
MERCLFPTNRSAAAAAAAAAAVHPWTVLLLLDLQDVGFTDLDNEVINLYFHTHYPNAVSYSSAR